MESGEQFVMMNSTWWMLMLLVVNWDSRDLYVSAVSEVSGKVLWTVML